MGKIVIKTLGLQGVNTDKNPLELSPDELTQSQNAVNEVRGAWVGLVKRQGLVEHSTDSGMGPVLGGVGVLESSGDEGLFTLFLGRGGEVP